MKITWFGHAAFLIEGTDKVLIDPFLDGNPRSPVRSKDVSCDIIIVTHGHGDHLGDAVEISKRTGAAIVGMVELARHCQAMGAKVDGMNLGTIKHGQTRITLTPAFHSAGIDAGDKIADGGAPVGAVVDFGGGDVVYHAGDTSLFSDMALIGKLYSPKVALLPIGDRYTMGPKEAAMAADLIKPKVVIPMHFGTFPAIQQDPEEFKRLVKSVRVEVLEPGGQITL
jgi:L-ascorbate metabolism protein UlaG (beta-lactamase superfamily)